MVMCTLPSTYVIGKTYEPTHAVLRNTISLLVTELFVLHVVFCLGVSVSLEIGPLRDSVGWDSVQSLPWSAAYMGYFQCRGIWVNRMPYTVTECGEGVGYSNLP